MIFFSSELDPFSWEAQENAGMGMVTEPIPQVVNQSSQSLSAQTYQQKFDFFPNNLILNMLNIKYMLKINNSSFF